LLCVQKREIDMAQTALNTKLALPLNVWVLFSEINCTFVVESGDVEIIGMDGAAPAADQGGITYAVGTGQDAATDTLGRFTGAGPAPDRLYARSRNVNGLLFVSRAAVA
jgi:hypothetical protein